MTAPDEIDQDIEEARQMRQSLAVRTAETEKLVRETVPAWRRMQLRVVQNSFGEEYDLSLTRRTA